MEPQFIYAECAACGHQYSYTDYRKLWTSRCLCGASNWKSRRYTQPKEKEMTDREKHLERELELELELMRAQEFEKCYKELREEIELKLKKEREAKRPALQRGQVWRHERGRHYIVMENKGFSLVSLIDGNVFNEGCGFGKWGCDFTYVGMARDCVKVKAEV